MSLGSPPADRPTAAYLSSHLGYSTAGQAIAWGSVPWMLFVLVEAPVATGVGVAVEVLFALTPAAVWSICQVAGPDHIRWFYREAGFCRFSPRGIEWRSHAFAVREPVQAIGWAQIAGVARPSARLSLIGRENQVVARIATDLMRLGPVDRAEDWSFAQALVAYWPEAFVLTDLSLYGQPAGARLRAPGELASGISPKALNRSRERQLAVYVLIVFVVGLVMTLVRT